MQGPLTRRSLLFALRDVADQQAWIDFIELYTPLIFGDCVRRGLQEADAQDVTQEVMRSVAKAIQKLDYDPGRGTFRAWLLTVTRSKLNNFLANRQRHAEVAADTTFHETLADPTSPDAEAELERAYQQRLFEVAPERVRPEFQETTWGAFGGPPSKMNRRAKSGSNWG